MQASLLIVDSIATNRVALKVKLSTAWYDVSVAANGEDALRMILRDKPNLVLVHDTLPDMHVSEISARLKVTLNTALPPIIALTQEETEREPLLRSGVADVLPVGCDDQLLMARIRSALRAHASEEEWRLRDGTTRALGFAEATQDFQQPVRVVCLHDQSGLPYQFRAQKGTPRLDVQNFSISEAMCTPAAMAEASVIILTLPEADPDRTLSVLSDLRANARTRDAAILVTVPQQRPDLAARALDLGADDATLGPVRDTEMSLRTRRLHTRREIKMSLRASVKNSVEAAIRDPLTGLYNRRYAIPHLERVAEQSRLSARPFAVMIADLDHFKRINDWYGHAAGDAVLIECANRLQKNMRAIDLVARYGGEEFLIVLPNTSATEARHAALRLCRKIAESPIAVPGHTKCIDVTVSIGLALSFDDTQSPLIPREMIVPNTLLSRADKALYQAKELGRNRFMLDRSAAA